ncbi:MAG: ABC transporter substrate-binding protein, partial [Gammaproteobacteria bacterium]
MRQWRRRQILGASGAVALGSVASRFASAALTAPTALLERVTSLPRPTDALMLMLPDGCQSNVDPVIQRFTEATGIAVRSRVVPVNEINTRLLIANGRNERIDLALPASYGLPNLVAANALLPLDDLLPSTSIEDSRSLYPLGDEFHRRVYGLQTDGDVYVMFYNRRVLEAPELVASFTEQYGRAPQPAQTFAQLGQLLRHYHAPDQGRFGGVLFRTPGYLAWEWWIRLHAKGRWPFDSKMAPQIASDEGVAALEEMVDATRFLHPEAFTAGLVRNWELFAQGNVLCNIGWGGSQKYFRSAAGGLREDVLVAPTPGARFADAFIEFGHFNWGWNFAVPRTSGHPELAGLFAAFATHPAISTIAVRAEGGFFDPFHTEHFNDP